MSVFSPIPLGQRIPGSPHSVACSLPTLHDIVGYEEGRPETTRHIASGYPRFVVHSHANIPPNYTVLGHVIYGMATFDRMVKAGIADPDQDGPPVHPIRLLKVFTLG